MEGREGGAAVEGAGGERRGVEEEDGRGYEGDEGEDCEREGREEGE